MYGDLAQSSYESPSPSPSYENSREKRFFYLTDSNDIQYIRSAKLNPVITLEILRDAQIEENTDVLGESLADIMYKMHANT